MCICEYITIIYSKKHVTLKIYRANKIEKKYTNKQKNHNFIYLGKKEFIFSTSVYEYRNGFYLIIFRMSF
jgi:hypothetical protein